MPGGDLGEGGSGVPLIWVNRALLRSRRCSARTWARMPPIWGETRDPASCYSHKANAGGLARQISCKFLLGRLLVVRTM